MFVGSVRVQINGAVIEDLIEQRSTALWQALTRGQDAGEPPPSFLKNLELMKEAFEEVDAEVETEQERPLAEGSTEVEADEAVAAIEEGSSATESPALDQPVEQEMAAAESKADEEPKS